MPIFSKSPSSGKNRTLYTLGVNVEYVAQLEPGGLLTVYLNILAPFSTEFRYPYTKGYFNEGAVAMRNTASGSTVFYSLSC